MSDAPVVQWLVPDRSAVVAWAGCTFGLVRDDADIWCVCRLTPGPVRLLRGEFVTFDDAVTAVRTRPVWRLSMVRRRRRAVVFP